MRRAGGSSLLASLAVPAPWFARAVPVAVPLLVGIGASACSATSTAGTTSSTAVTSPASGSAPTSSGVNGSSGARPSTGPGSSVAAGSSSTYPSLTEIAETLTQAGLTCSLEYEALRDDSAGTRELSLCTIDGELVELRIWTSAEPVTKLVASLTPDDGALAYGRDWTVSVGDPALAARIATALGGASVNT